MTKVLLVDTNFSSAPIYRALLEAGHEVHVAGANPGDCLAKMAPHYWQVDYSDTKALSGLVDDQGFECLVPGCTDRSYASCVAVGRGRFPGLDSAEAALSISHKARFRQMAASLGLPVPRIYSSIGEAGRNAVIVKPVDAFSGKGITVLRDPPAVTSGGAIERARAASPSGGFLIEEFVEGQLYSHSAFVVGRQIVRDFLVQEDGTANPFVVDTSRVIDPSSSSALLRNLRACVERIVSHLGLADGVFHTQFIGNGEEFWLIESTRRCPGDLYSQLIELSTGFDYARAYILPFMGQPEARPEDAGRRPIMRHTISVPAERRLDHVRFLRPLNLERYVPLSLVGDLLMPSPNSRIAVIFCSEESEEALDLLYAATLRRKLYDIPDGAHSSSDCPG